MNVTIHHLIEYREDNRTVGYIKDMRRGDGGFDVCLTRDATKALQFDNSHSAQSIIDDWAFQRTVPYADHFFVEEHMSINRV